MIEHLQMRQPTMLIEALFRQLSRIGTMIRSDLYWRFARPGSFRQRFEQAVTNMSHGICLYDANDRLQLVNEQFCRIYNQPMSTLHVGMSFRDILANSIAIGNYPGMTTDQVWRKRKAFIDQRQPGTFLQELGDGRLIAIAHQPLLDGGWVATYEDITERRRAEMQIKFMAEHDALTQLPNRLLFGGRLERELANAKEGAACSLICLDLDGFKLVNDRLGHAAGDLLLRQVADRLRLSVRGEDVPARLGGDEFAVLLPQTGTAEALAIATRIGAALRSPYDLGASGPAAIGVSIGVACAPDHADAADLLMSHADTALYVAKHSSAALPVAYDPQQPWQAGNWRAVGDRRFGKPDGSGDPGARRMAAMLRDLRIARQTGRLSLHYRPVGDCATANIVAYEAVPKWHDLVPGSLLPMGLAPAAEDAELAVALGDWLLRWACADAAGWGGAAPVCVSLPPSYAGQADLAASVASVLGETGLPPHRLVIEFTGDVLLDPPPLLPGAIEGLRALGVELWLEDFGTGYADVASLRAGPFGAVRIGPSFLAGGPDGAAVLTALVGLGKACGAEVVVDGVETAEQLGWLRALGCDRVQGALLGPPGTGGNDAAGVRATPPAASG